MINRQYEDLLSDVLHSGAIRKDRTGVGTRSLFGAQMRFDLSDGFPLITTKKVFMKGVTHELIWLLSGNTNIQYLLDNDVHIWDAWADENGDLGPVYGAQWRSWRGLDALGNETYTDQIAALIEGIQADPYSRRHIVNSWNVSELDDMALPPCHTFFQMYVQGGKLSCQLYQRSADLFLGVPFNIASYALLTHMIADQTGLEVGDFVHTIGDAHIYENHKDQVEEQLKRDVKEFPELILQETESIDHYTYEDVLIVNYQHHPAISAPVAV